MTVQEAENKVRNEDALEYCQKQSMLEQMVASEKWKHYHYASEALEKQIPEIPSIEGDGYCPEGNLVYDTWICPNCGKDYEIEYDDYDYCPKCGQKIDKSVFDWEECAE